MGGQLQGSFAQTGYFLQSLAEEGRWEEEEDSGEEEDGRGEAKDKEVLLEEEQAGASSPSGTPGSPASRARRRGASSHLWFCWRGRAGGTSSWGPAPRTRPGGAGYRLAQICKSSPCSSLPRFSLCVTLQSASLLSSLLHPGTVLGPADTYFHYSLLGVDISTEPFPSLEEPNFWAEKAMAQILACPSVLSSFLAREEPPIMLLSEEPPTRLF